MTPKEKAQKLYDHFYELGHLIETDYAKNHCKKCALVVADEIIKHAHFITANQEAYTYWLEVKTEINKL